MRGRGSWKHPAGVPGGSYKFECSLCHRVAFFISGYNGTRHKNDATNGCGYKFCPRCGAEMMPQRDPAGGELPGQVEMEGMP